jgi:ParB family chromosome partitioning protein
MQAELALNFETKLKINKGNNGNGKIVIPFKNDIELNRILELLDK